MILFLLSIPYFAKAQNTLELEAGTKLSLHDGVLFIESGGKKTRSEKIADDVSNDLTEQLKLYKLKHDFIAAHALVEDKLKTRHEAVFVFNSHKSSSTIKLIWKAKTSPSGDPGERIADAVRFEDLDSDGFDEIVIGKISEAHCLCGVSTPQLLFREVYDLEKSRFRSILAKRPDLMPATDIVGTTEDDASLKPLIDQTSAESASRSLGDKKDVIFLTKPASAVDGNSNTAWSFYPQNGAGEFVTFKVSADVYGITKIGIRSLPNFVSKPKYDRPKTLILSTENGTYRLLFPEDPVNKPEAFWWFNLPKPTSTSCFSLTIETTHAPHPDMYASIADIRVLTEIDTPEGLNRLANDLNVLSLRRQAAMLLKKAGSRSFEPINSVWKTLDISGRRLAIDVLVETSAAEAIELLCDAVVGKDEILRETAIKGLWAAPEKAASVLAKHLLSKDDERFQNTARILSSLRTPNALDALVLQLGKTNRQRRLFLTGRIAESLQDTVVSTESLWSHFEKAVQHNETERLPDLLRASAEFASLQDRVLESASLLYDKANTFSDRYRLLEVLGIVTGDASRQRLFSAATDNDPQIRAVAVTGLASYSDSAEAQKIIGKALVDKEPAVRIAALNLVFDKKTGNFNEILPLVEQTIIEDPWPKVRSKAIRLVTLFSRDKALGLILKGSRDTSSDVRQAALLSVIGYFGADADAIIEERLSTQNETHTIRTAAAMAVGNRCQKTALPALFNLLKKGAEPLASDTEIEVAVTAAKAMGNIGTKEAVSMLKEALKRSNPATDRAIENALKNPGAVCASTGKTNSRLTDDKLPTTGGLK